MHICFCNAGVSTFQPQWSSGQKYYSSLLGSFGHMMGQVAIQATPLIGRISFLLLHTEALKYANPSFLSFFVRLKLRSPASCSVWDLEVINKDGGEVVTLKSWRGTRGRRGIKFHPNSVRLPSTPPHGESECLTRGWLGWRWWH